MKFLEKKENYILYIRLLVKKIRDMKLRKKMNLFLFSTTILACISIGFLSFEISSQAIISNTEIMSINLMKQIGLNLDERINAFGEISYQLSQTEAVRSILTYDSVEAEANRRASNSAFNTEVLQQSSLYTYTRYALLRSNSGVVTEYYKPRETKLSLKEEEAVLDSLEDTVTVPKPTNWVQHQGQVYFVRRIIENCGEEVGILCFAMTDEFFSFVGTEQDYLSNDNVVIVGRKGTLLKQDIPHISEKQIRTIADYKNFNYYVYNCMIEVSQEKYVVVALNTLENEWTVIGFMPYARLVKNIQQIYLMILLVIILVLIAGMIATTVIARTITKNVSIIEQGMKNYESGRFEIRIKPSSYDEIGLLALQLNFMGIKISELIRMVEEQEAAKRKSEYQTLQAQINPHFLYNTLGSIKWAAYRREEKETAASIDALIALLRFTIKRSMQILPLREEIDYIRNYIAIEQVRYGDALHMFYEIEDGVLDWNIPGFILQPFIENALIHGLDMAAEYPRITVRAYRKDSSMYLEVEDNGIGIDQETISQIWIERDEKEHVYKGFNSIGIRIVDERLHSYYGDEYRTVINSKEKEGTIITLVIPRSLEGETDV